MTKHHTYSLLSAALFLIGGFVFWWTGVAPIIGFAMVILSGLFGLAGFANARETNAH